MNLKNIEIRLDEYHKEKNTEKIMETAQLLLQESLKQNNPYYQIIASYHIAAMYYTEGRSREALKLAVRTLPLCSQVDIPFYEMVLHNLAGIIYGAFGEEITSIEHLLKAYYITFEYPDIEFIYIVENNIGVLFYDLFIYDIAYEYFKKSLKRRNINSIKDIQERDGYNIVNLVGCCIKMKKEDEYKKWIPYLTYYIEHYENEIIQADATLYDIYKAYFNSDHSLMKHLAHQMMIQTQHNKDKLHSMKNIDFVFQLFLEIKEQDICDSLLKQMKDILKEYPDYKYMSKLNDYRIQMDMVFHDKDALLDSLYAYYINKKKEDDTWRKNLKQSLITKVELEESLHKQMKIIRENEELIKNSEIEDFTRVMNKTAFRKHVIMELKNFKDDQYMAMMLVDLDKFKRINDIYGHLSGDRLLLDMTDILKREMRKSDYIGRFGGDEFCIFIKNILSLDYVKEIAERLLRYINEIHINGIDYGMTVSIGIQVISSSTSYEKLFHDADQLMYKAKEAGGNQYCMKIDEEGH